MTNRKPPRVTWESWIEKQIRTGIEDGLFEGLPGKGQRQQGLEEHHDEDWWVKAKMRRERLSYLPPTLAIRKEREEALAAIHAASSEVVVRRIVGDINERIRAVNRRGAEGPPSTVVPLDEEAVVEKWRSRRTSADGR
jgi:hypothetical protein